MSSNTSITPQLVVSDLKALSSVKIPVSAAPGATPGSICISAVGPNYYILVRKPNGSVGTIAIP